MLAMRLIPYSCFDILLADPAEVLAARLAARTTPETWWSRFTGGSPFWFSTDGFLFAGEVSKSGFRVRRIISYGNSFRPRLCGQFIPTADGTRVEVAMRFPETRGVLAFMGLTGVFGILAIIALLSSEIRQWPFVLIPWS